MHTSAVLPCAYFAPLGGDFTFLFGFFVLKKLVRRSTFLVDVGKVKEEGTACKATFFSMPFPHLRVPVFPDPSLSKNALWTKLFSSADEIYLHCGRKKFALRTKFFSSAVQIPSNCGAVVIGGHSPTQLPTAGKAAWHSVGRNGVNAE